MKCSIPIVLIAKSYPIQLFFIEKYKKIENHLFTKSSIHITKSCPPSALYSIKVFQFIFHHENKNKKTLKKSFSSPSRHYRNLSQGTGTKKKHCPITVRCPPRGCAPAPPPLPLTTPPPPRGTPRSAPHTAPGSAPSSLLPCTPGAPRSRRCRTRGCEA